MTRLKCRMIISSSSEHLSQLYTGYTLLSKLGIIDLEQEYYGKNTLCKTELRSAIEPTHLLVILNDSLRIWYDTHDSGNINMIAAEASDYYFKRSYLPSMTQLRIRAKLLPLGLNYAQYTGVMDLFELQRIWSCQRNHIQRIREIIRTFPIVRSLCFTPSPANIFSSPDYSRSTRILFAVRAWDPVDTPCIPKENIKELNEKRAMCILLLRKEFGSNFTGGFQHTQYAKNKFGYALLPDSTISDKKNYIKLLKDHPICISTTGLHNSIGWKFAEYVAFSRAIVTEKLHFMVPGDFSEGQNYLQFGSAEQCVEQAERLITDLELRYRMMENNHSYYLSFLRPDALILRTLVMALSGSNLLH